MALKRKITKSAYDKLSDELKKEYKSSGEDEYSLDVDGDEDTGALKRARDREKQRADDEKKRADELEDAMADFKRNQSREEKDVERLTRKHEKELTDLKTEKDGALAKATAKITTAALESTAMQIAQAITKSPKLLLPVIKQRLTVEIDGDFVPTIKILDAAGKPSAAKLEDLQKEIASDKEFAPIIIASKASGSGADTRQDMRTAVPGFPNQNSGEPPSLARLSPAQLAAQLTANKANAGT
jgi:hypothetical protein